MAIKIYIDQGHNPVNPNAGAEANGLREQNLVYTIGRELAELLRAQGDFEVRLSRPTAETQLGDSVASSLSARVRDANAWGADYFISLHTNASTSPDAEGIEALVYADPSTAASLGRDILRRTSALTDERNRGIKVRSGLYVLRKTNMPAVLVELGFISNPREAALMRDSPELYARGVYEGILDYTGL